MSIRKGNNIIAGVGSTKRNLGEVYFSQSSLAIDNSGSLPLFTGETIVSANTIYPDLYNFVLANSDRYCTSVEYENALITYGECGKYALGRNYTQSYKWHIPNINIDVYTTNNGLTVQSDVKDRQAYVDPACTELYLYNGVSIGFAPIDDNGTIKPYFDYRADDGQTAIEILEPNSYILMDVPGEPNGSLRLPLIKNYIKAAGANEGIKNIEAGLPNITGELNAYGFNNGWNKATGPFASNEETLPRSDYQGGNGVGLSFDASRSSSVYGSSDTVTPASTTLYPWVVAYTAAIPASTAQAAEFQNALSGKLDLPSGKAQTDVDFVVEGYSDDEGNWYRVYKSGWVEQGGKVPYSAGDAYVSVNLLKSMKNTNYQILMSYQLDDSSSRGDSMGCFAVSTTQIKVGRDNCAVFWEVKGMGE